MATEIFEPMRFTIDLDTGLVTKPQRTQLNYGDVNANRIIVRVIKNKQGADLSGVSATGSFYRPGDRAQIELNGEVSGSEASVTLIDHCYAVEGEYEAEVKLTYGGVTRTILSITGYVHRAGSGALVDVAGVVPNINELLAQIQATKDAAEAANAAADKANDAASHAPYIGEDGNWYTWDSSAGEYVSTGTPATGPEGEAGTDGENGLTPHIGENGNWWIGERDTGVQAQGPAGENGTGSGTVTAVTVSGTKYEPDQTGNVDLGELGGGDFKDLGNNPIASQEDDTTDKWVKLGSGYAFYNTSDLLSEQPNTWGVLLNTTKVNEVFQIWNSQPDGPTYFRSGNASGWNGSWRMAYDTRKKPTAADVGALPSGGTAADSEKLGGKAPEYYIQPRNLLDNSDFRNPVNQRGIPYGGDAYSGYKIDRWHYEQVAGAGDGYFGLTEYYVSLLAPSDGYSQMHQNLERYDKMKGGNYTFAAQIQYGDNTKTVRAVSFKMGGASGGLKLIEDGNLELYSVDDKNVLIRANGRTEYKFIWAALYEGSYTADDLPPYVPEKLVTELITCQRYALVIGGAVRYRATQVTSSVIDFTIPIPVKMRTTPSFDASALTVYGTSGNITSANAQTGFTFSILQVDDNAICIRATKSAHGLVDAFLNVAERTVFSADL